MKFRHFTRGTPCEVWGSQWPFDEILMGVPLRIALNFNEIHTFHKGYPLQNVRKSVDIRWAPKGYPLGFHWSSMKLTHFTRGIPLQHVRKSTELRSNSKGYPLRMSSRSNAYKAYPLQNVRKSIKTRWDPKAHPLGLHWTSFSKGTPCNILENPLKFDEILRVTP